MKRLLPAVAAVVALLAVVLVARAATFTAPAPVGAAAAPLSPSARLALEAPLPADAPAHLSAAIRARTISYFDSTTRLAAFDTLHAGFAAAFSRVHATLRQERFDGAGLLMTWTGSDPSLAPVVLMAHQDVVPVEPGSERTWTHPPFDGVNDGEFIWGRGAMDDKSALVGTLEAMESLLASGWQPRRTVMLVFGHMEEKGGAAMRALVDTLQARGVRPLFVLDEGGSLVAEGVVPGVRGRVALVGTAEKGYLSLRITASGDEGHSSMPPRHTAVGTLAAALARLEASPMPARLEGASRETLETLAPAMPFGQRLAIANLWLTRPLLLRMLGGTPAGNATIRTTTAPTMLQGSTKDNVMPMSASAVVNFRLLPGDRVADVVAHVRDAVGDARVTVDTIPDLVYEASPVSPTNTEGFATVRSAITESWPDARVAPYLVVGATDSRFLARLTPNVYRFAPLVVDPVDLKRIHGIDERVRVRDYLDGVRFLRRLIVRAAG